MNMNIIKFYIISVKINFLKKQILIQKLMIKKEIN